MGLWAVATVLLAAGPVPAAGPSPAAELLPDVAALPPSLAYVAPPECPPEGAFDEALARRLGHRLRARLWGTALRVRLEANPGAQGSDAAYRGQLLPQLVEVEGLRRTIEGSRCDSVVEALALVAALGLERLPEPARAATPLDAAPEALSRRSAPTFQVALAGQLENAAAFRPSWDWGVVGALSWPERWGRPSVWLGVLGSAQQEAGLSGFLASASLQRTSVSTGACWGGPLLLGTLLPGSVRAEPCWNVVAGRLAVTGQGDGVEEGSTGVGWWGASGPGFRLSVSASPWLELGFDAAWLASLARPRFYFEPGVTAFRVAPGGARLGAWAGLVF